MGPLHTPLVARSLTCPLSRALHRQWVVLSARRARSRRRRAGRGATATVPRAAPRARAALLSSRLGRRRGPRAARCRCRSARSAPRGASEPAWTGRRASSAIPSRNSRRVVFLELLAQHRPSLGESALQQRAASDFHIVAGARPGRRHERTRASVVPKEPPALSCPVAPR